VPRTTHITGAKRRVSAGFLFYVLIVCVIALAFALSPSFQTEHHPVLERALAFAFVAGPLLIAGGLARLGFRRRRRRRSRASYEEL
jgi:hypothetical protein